jgi:monovalent cation/proton antiporter MnhG/PhaG subunit
MMDIFAYIFITLGLVFYLLGLVVFLKLNDGLKMLHFSAIPEFFGFTFVAIGSCLLFSSFLVAFKITIMLSFVFLTSPVSASLVANVVNKWRD